MRNRPIVSIFSQQQQDGEPVFVKKVTAEDVPLLTKLTLRPQGGVVFEGYVPRVIQEKLSAGQDIYAAAGGGGAIGYITAVSREISLNTGMFYVQAVFEKAMDSNGWQVVYVDTGTLNNVICLPDDIIDREKDNAYVWKVESGRAVKQEITIGRHNGYGAVVLSGLDEGDLVVYKGFTRLSEGDSVNIIEDMDNSGVRQ